MKRFADYSFINTPANVARLYVAMNRRIVFRLQLVLLDKATRKCFRYPAEWRVAEDDSRVTWQLEQRVPLFFSGDRFSATFPIDGAARSDARRLRPQRGTAISLFGRVACSVTRETRLPSLLENQSTVNSRQGINTPSFHPTGSLLCCITIAKQMFKRVGILLKIKDDRVARYRGKFQSKGPRVTR